MTETNVSPVLLATLYLTVYTAFGQPTAPLASSTYQDPASGTQVSAMSTNTKDLHVTQTRSASRVYATSGIGDVEHRVILKPGLWKIRSVERSKTYITYQFFLGFNWTDLEIHYPTCSQIACEGLSAPYQGCDSLCSTGTWPEATLTLNTAMLDYIRAMDSLDATVNDLAAIMDTHVVNQHSSPPDSVAKLLYHSKTADLQPRVDVMRYHRSLIEQAIGDLTENFPITPHADRRLPHRSNVSMFNELLDAWKGGAFTLAVMLNSITVAFRGAQQRLLLCAQCVERSDMTGCEPEFAAEFYTDTPVATSSVSASRLILVAEREFWDPTVLSRWYMAFVDSSNDNRTCWLARPMLNDTSSNYRSPQCDTRGICEPLEVDNVTITACQVSESGELSLLCPVVCGSQCFGPLCYRLKTNAYWLIAAPGVSQHRNDFIVTAPPRTLSKTHSLSETDIQRSLAEIRNLSLESLELWMRGGDVLQDIVAMELVAREYIRKARSEKHTRCDGVPSDYEHTLSRSSFMAAVSITLSALTCPLLIFLVTKMRSDTTNRSNAPVRHKDSAETLL